MRRIIKYVVFIIILSLFFMFALYKCEEKNLFNENINQLKFNYILLEILDQGRNAQVATLLSADTQRILIYMGVNNAIKDVNGLCQYVDNKHINLLNKYDKNISNEYINRIIGYCVKKSEHKHTR